jgi:hypothetical protein
LGRPNHLQQRQDRSQDTRRQGRNVPRPRHHHQIIAQVQQLVRGGHAYELDDGWYIDLASFPDYGKLSGRIDSRPGGYPSRIEHRVGKRNPGDFALWKARKEGEPFWDAPLGPGLSAALITLTADPDQRCGACLMVATAFSSSCFGQAGFRSRQQTVNS